MDKDKYLFKQYCVDRLLYRGRIMLEVVALLPTTFGTSQ